MRLGIAYMLLALVAAASALDGCSLISSPGTYTLTTDLFGANISVATPYAGSPQSACIAITSSDVVLDCAGFGINGNGTNNTFGVVMQKTDNSSITNVTVKNCDISDYPAADVFAYNMSGGTIANNTLEEGAGAVLYGGSQNAMNGNDALNDTGFLLISSTDNTLKGDSVADGFGFLLMKGSDRNTLNGTVVLGNSSGIQLNDSGNATIANTFMDFTGIFGNGIVLSNSSYNKVTNSTLTGDEFSGVLFFGDTVSHNVFSKTNLTADVPLVFGMNNTDSADVNHFTDNVIGNTTISGNSTLGLVIFSNDTRNNVIADSSLTGDNVEFFAAISNGDFINNTLRNNNVTANNNEGFEFGGLNDAINNTVLNTRINTNVTFFVAGVALNDFANNKIDKTVVNTSALAGGIAMVAQGGDFTNNSITNTNVAADLVGVVSVPFPFIGAGGNLDGNRFINTTFTLGSINTSVPINSTNAMNNQFINTKVTAGTFGDFFAPAGLEINTLNDFTNNTFANTTVTTDNSGGIVFSTMHDFSGNSIQNTKLANMSGGSMIGGLIFETGDNFTNNKITGTSITANVTQGLLTLTQNNSAGNVYNNTKLDIGFGLGGPAFLFETFGNLTDNSIANTNVTAIDDLGFIVFSGGNATGNTVSSTRYAASDNGTVFVFASEGGDMRNNTLRDTAWNANNSEAFAVFAANDFIGNSVLNTRHNTNTTMEFIVGGANNTLNNTVANTNVTGNLIGEMFMGSPIFLGPGGGDVVNNLFQNTSVSGNLTDLLLFSSGNDFVNNTISNTRFFANESEAVGVIAQNNSVGNLVSNTNVSGGFIGEVIFEALADASSNRIQNTNIDTNLTEAFFIAAGNFTNNSVTDTRMRTNLSEGMLFMVENDSLNNSIINTNITGNMTALLFQTANDFIGNRVQNSNLNANLTQGIFFETGNDFRNNTVSSTALNANLSDGILFMTGNNSAFNTVRDTSFLANQSEGVIFETGNDFVNNSVSNTRILSNQGGLLISEAGNNTLGNRFSNTNVTSNATESGFGIFSDGSVDSNNVSATTISANLTDEGFAITSGNVTNNRIDRTTVLSNVSAFGFIVEGSNTSNNVITNTVITSNNSTGGMLVEGDPANSTNNTITNVANTGGNMFGIGIFVSNSLIDPITTTSAGVGMVVEGNNNSINQLTAFNNFIAGFSDLSMGGPASTLSNSLLYNNSWEIVQGSTSGQFTIINTKLGSGIRQSAISLNDSVDAGYMLNDTGSPGSAPPGMSPSTARYLKLNFTSGGSGESQIDSLSFLNAGSSMFTWNSTNVTPFWVPTPNQVKSGTTVTATTLVNITSDDIYSYGQLSTAPSGGGTTGGGSSTPSLEISFNQSSGIVTVTSGGAPVAGADVKVDGSGIGTTDSNGQAAVPGCNESVTIDALKSGYAAATAAETLKSCQAVPACAADSECPSTQSCSAGACVPVNCPNGSVVDHACVVPQNQTNQTQCAAPSCCTSSGQCLDTQACVSASGAPGSVSSPGSCQEVTGQCGAAANHAFVPYGYECGTEAGCPSCPSGQSCEEHKCVQNDITCPSSVVVGGNATCKATQNDQACGPADNCTATVTTPDGRTMTIPPDDNGNVVVPGSVTGRVKVDLLKNGAVVKEVFIDVVPKSEPTGTSAPAASGPDLSFLWLLLLLAIIIGAVVYWRSRSKK